MYREDFNGKTDVQVRGRTRFSGICNQEEKIEVGMSGGPFSNCSISVCIVFSLVSYFQKENCLYANNCYC